METISDLETPCPGKCGSFTRIIDDGWWVCEKCGFEFGRDGSKEGAQ